MSRPALPALPAMPKFHRILMLKGHAAGIGDLLRSTPAWRALKDRFGADTALHLAVFTSDPDYPSGPFMRQQALLDGLTIIPKEGSGLAAWRAQLQQLDAVVRQFRPDLIVDFEPHGSRSALLTAVLGRRHRVATLGIAQFPGRGLFYRLAAPRGRFKVHRDGWLREIDYADRDFVALAALGIGRNGRAIEMSLLPHGRAYGERLRTQLGLAPHTPLIGLNIGCGTPNAQTKRPDFTLVGALLRAAHARLGGAIVLTGAPNERAVNQAFLREQGATLPPPIFDLAGRTDLYELGGVIAQCRLFISSDSGPYHMAVALRVPTLALFNHDNRQAFHDHPWVRRVVRGPHGDDDLPAAERTLAELVGATA